MASPEPNDEDRIVELVVRDASDSAGDADADAVAVSEDFAPLLTQPERPRTNIFTLSYPRRKSRDEVTRLLESEPSSLTRFILWVWSGSRYSGFLCMVLSSATYFLMEVLSNIFSGLACSFFGVLFFFHEMLATQGQLVKAEEESSANYKGSRIFALLLGLVSSITGGSSFCCIRAAAKASDQPLVTVLAFSMLASPVMAICAFVFEDFVLPGFQSIILMLVLSVLAFFAEVLLARGLQLERIGKIVNVLYLEVELSQLWRLAFSRVLPSFGQVTGFLLVIVSVCWTLYLGPDKELE